MKDRISKLMREEQISSSKLAEIIGVQASSISHYLSGRNKPSIDFIQKLITRFKNISAEWLITGKGEMYKINPISNNLFATKNEEPSPPIFENKIEKIQKPNIEKIAIEKNETLIENMSDKKIINKEVKKIVFFYSDNSFSEYYPSK